MGIGTSLGAYYDDDFQHHAGVPVLPKGDEEMVKKPKDTGDDNVLPPDEGTYNQPTTGLTRVRIVKSDPEPGIEDRRDEDHTNTIKQDGTFNWEGIPKSLRDVAVSAGNSLWGTPRIEEAPVSDISRSLGHEDIKIEKDVGRSFLSRGIEDIQQGLNVFGVAKGKSWGESLTEEGSFSSGKMGDKLFGWNGVERYKTWPEKMILGLQDTAKKVSAGEIPMWAMTPDGEFHTSIEGLEAAHALMPAGNSGMFPRIHLRGEGLKALETYHEAPYETTAAQQMQEMLARIRRQPSNIVEEIAPVERTPAEIRADRMFEQEALPLADTWAAEARNTATEFARAGEENPYLPERYRGRNADSMTDAEFYDYGQYQARGRMTNEQEARWTRIDREEAASTERELREYEEHYSRNDIREEFNDDWDPGYRATNSEGIPNRWSTAVQEKVKEALSSESIKLVKDEHRSGGRDHEFKFASKDGIGQLNITEKRNGKELYIDTIGKIDKRTGNIPWHDTNSAAHTFGTREILQLVKQLAKEFPKAEEIVGFRVSGARVNSGSGESRGSMKIPRRKQGPVIDAE